MPYEQLYERLPAVAETETRSITLLEDSMELGLPAADYGFLEMFCNEPGCDCRRVFFTVISSRSQDMEAVICFGWEKKEFYHNWAGYALSEGDIEELQGPGLNLGAPETQYSDGILELFKKVLWKDQEYIERVKRHYRMFRATVDKPRPSWARRRRTGG